jgi:uncharacterized protein (UPF0335 family)
MVKKREKAAAEPQQGGWGLNPPSQEEVHTPGEGGGNISDNPEDRRPPMDEGWDGANAHGQGPDTANGPNPDYVPPADEKPKPKKRKGKTKEAAELALAATVKTVPSASGDVTTKHNAEGGQLISIVERVERLAEEKKTIADDMKEVMAEAKAAGYDVGTIRKVLARRKLGKDAVDEMDAILDLYESQVGFN